MNNSMLGLFEHADILIKTAGSVKKLGYEVTIISPIPLDYDIKRIFGPKKDIVEYFTGLGAVTGLFFGTVFALGTAFLYALPRGGRPIFPVTPTLLIAFETTILLSVLMTFIGFLIFLRWFAFKGMCFHPDVTAEKFCLLVNSISGDKLNEIETILKGHGAYDIHQIKM